MTCYKYCISSVQLLSCVQLFVTPRTVAHQASLSITNTQSLLKLMSIEPVMPSNHLILCCLLLLLPSIFPSIRVFSNESVLRIRWPKYWSFSFSISPSNEYSGLIFFRLDWLDLLAVQGTPKNLLQHHSSKAPILQHSAFFIVQLSHPYMTVYWKLYEIFTLWTRYDYTGQTAFPLTSGVAVLDSLPHSEESGKRPSESRSQALCWVLGLRAQTFAQLLLQEEQRGVLHI